MSVPLSTSKLLTTMFKFKQRKIIVEGIFNLRENKVKHPSPLTEFSGKCYDFFNIKSCHERATDEVDELVFVRAQETSRRIYKISVNRPRFGEQVGE